MSGVWTAFLVALVAACLVWGVARPERAYEYPFLAAMLVCGFVLPQLPGLMHDPFVSPDAYAKAVFMTVLCVLAAISGWFATRAPIGLFEAAFCERRLGHVAIVFSLVGAYFYYTLSRLPGEMVVGVQMSGAPVIYIFFARLLTYGLAIASLCYARRPSWLMLAVMVFCLAFYLERILVTGKRAEAAELALILLLPLWFYHRVKVPRLALVFGAVVGALAMTSMSDYRDITRANSRVVGRQIAEIDVVGNFSDLLEHGGPEMRNAITLIDAIDRSEQFDYGAVHWNQIIWNYVPAQVFGPRIKSALMLDIPLWPRDFVPLTGTTFTGMVDAFSSFWYFGAVKFFLLAYVLRRFWQSAMAGQAMAQLLYMLSVVPATLAFSHMSDWVVAVWIHMLIFLAPALVYAAAPVPDRPGARLHPPPPALDF